jgi:colanic acid biosynthesis glycosyl transferase WcaI
MHIVILNQYYAPDEAATAQIAGDLGAHLAGAGHRVTAICADRSYAQPRKTYPRREVIDNVSVVRVRTTAFGRGTTIGRVIDYVGFVAGAMLQLMKIKSNVVVALTTPPIIAYVALLVRRIRRYRLVFWSMDIYPDVAFRLGIIRRNSVGGKVFARMAKTVLRSADVVVALGDMMATTLRSLGAKHVEVVHNWADEAVIIPLTATDRPSRVKSGWAQRFVLLYSGNLGLAHEFDTIIGAARTLSRLMPNALFAFAGVGPRLNEVREATRDLPNVAFQSYVKRSQLGDTLVAADVHLVTLRPEMVGLLVPSKIYGILAAGRPTIFVGPATGEIHDILRDGQCGRTVANDDVDELVKTIREYASDQPRRDREGRNARSYFEAHFTKRKSLRHLQDIIEST